MPSTRLFEVLDQQAENYPQSAAVQQKIAGQYQGWTIERLRETVDKLALGLIAHGVKPGENVGLIGYNSIPWVVLDFALQKVGAVSVPMYPNLQGETYTFICRDAGIKRLFIGSPEILEEASKANEALGGKLELFALAPQVGVPSWETLLAKADLTYRATLEERIKDVTTESLLTLIYTSGTTGDPKGVMLTHSNLLHQVRAATPLLPVTPGDTALSFLPICHVYERMLVYLYLANGIQVAFAESMDTIADNLKEVRPHIFTTVPRLLEKVYGKIEAKSEAKKGIMKAIALWGLRVANKYDLHNNGSLGYRIQHFIADKLVFKKWRAALGGRVRVAVSGSAALQPRLARIFWCAGVPILEGYGLTETSPVISVNRYERSDHLVGTVGPLIAEVEVKFGENDEILTRGPHVMKGYYNKPEATAKVIDAEGWFHTGDCGTWVDGRFLKITGRTKEIFKTAGGKYIAPLALENELKTSRYVEQVLVVGEYQRFPGALIVPNPEALEEWAERQGLPHGDMWGLVKQPAVQKLFETEVAERMEKFANYERVKKFLLLPEIWSIESGELTPTLKPKRSVILKNQGKAIEEMYLETH